MHSSGAFSEILVYHTYKTALNRTSDKPLSLSTYVDDAHTIWGGEKQSFLKFVAALNDVWPGQLHFTYEFSNEENKLSFLDILVHANSRGIVEHELYQKPTNSGKYLHYSSHCPMRTKSNIITSEARRILRNCSSIDLAWKHLEKLREDLINSEYPHDKTTLLIAKTVSQHLNPSTTNCKQKDKGDFDFILRIPYIDEAKSRIMQKIADNSGFKIRVVTTPGNSVKSLIKEKVDSRDCQCVMHQHNIDCKQRYIVYQATCQLCNEKYIGGSARPTSERLNEHEASVRLQNTRTTLGEHVIEKHSSTLPLKTKGRRDYDNFFKFYDFKVRRKCRDTLETFIYEGLDIANIKPGLNNMTTNGFVCE